MKIDYHKLSKTELNILHVKGNFAVGDSHLIQDLAETLKKDGYQCLVIASMLDMTIEMLDEKEMNKHGWFRKEP